MKTLIVFIIGLILYGIVAAYRRVDNKIDEQKLKINSNDENVIEKSLMKSAKLGKMDATLEIAKRLVEINPNNILALSFLAIDHYQNGLYNDALPMLEKLINNLLTDDAKKSLYQKWCISFTGDEYDFIYMPLIARVYYYFGDTAYRNGNIQDAIAWKEKAAKFSKQVLKENLY